MSAIDPVDPSFMYVGTSGSGVLAIQASFGTPEITVPDSPLQITGRVGQTSTGTVLISNSGSGRLSVSRIMIDGEDGSRFGVQPGSATIGPGESATFTISFTPSAEGSATALIRFAHNASGGEATVQLQGTTGPPPTTGADLFSLDLNGDARVQLLLDLGVREGQKIELQIFGKDLPAFRAYSLDLKFDSTLVKVVGGTVGDLAEGYIGILSAPVEGRQTFFGNSITGGSSEGSGLLATFELEIHVGFEEQGGSEVILEGVALTGPSNETTRLHPNLKVKLSVAPDPQGGDVVFAVGDVSGHAKDTGVAIPIDVDHATGMSSGALVIIYESEVLLLKEVRPGPLAEAADLEISRGPLSAAGLLTLIITGENGLTDGSGTLVELVFDVVETAGEGEYNLGLSVTGIQDANRTALSVADVRSGTFIVEAQVQAGPLGDFDGDSVVGFRDFIMFAQKYGLDDRSSDFDGKFDLDSVAVSGSGIF